MALRAQVSLIFNDAQLYEGLIVPLKQSRELTNVIINCLSAYFYNEEVRSLVDGVSQEDSSSQESEDYTQAVEQMRALIFTQNAIINSMKNTMEDATEDIEDIFSHVNDTSMAHGFTETQETEFGTRLLVNKEKIKNISDGLESEFNDIRSRIKGGNPEVMADAVVDLGKLLLSHLVSASVTTSYTPATESQPVDSEETISYVVHTESAKVVSEPKVEIPAPTEQIIEHPIEEEKIDEPVVEDATAALQSAFSSLTGLI